MSKPVTAATIDDVRSSVYTISRVLNDEFIQAEPDMTTKEAMQDAYRSLLRAHTCLLLAAQLKSAQGGRRD